FTAASLKSQVYERRILAMMDLPTSSLHSYLGVHQTWGSSVFNAGFVPAVSICTLVLLRLGGLRLHWGAVALFAAWAAIIGLLEGLLIVGIYASV
ncbi:MAG TPA: hypothetical protein VKD90_15250, partial [Gemmataceae bacterium]|nr:hypothetical protein [Gemmataceae bacterium]